MVYSTSYLGRLGIEPPLNAGEVEGLRAFARTQRPSHPDDTSAVPMNPGSEHRQGKEATGQRGGGRLLPGTSVIGLPRCDWLPCVEDCSLDAECTEKSTSAPSELAHLIDHFLPPGALSGDEGWW